MNLDLSNPDNTLSSNRTIRWHFVLSLILFITCYIISLQILANRVQYNDDAFITFRVAQNLADGNGPYYNPDEQMQASTTPLYVLLLALGRTITGQPVVQIENFLQPIWITAIALLLFAIGRCIPTLRPAAMLLPILLVIQPYEFLQVKGMEAFLFTALILLVILMEIRNAPILCGLAIGLAACTRTEGGVLGLIYLIYWISGRLAYGKETFSTRDLSRTTFSAILIGLPFLTFVCFFYGSPLPQSVQGKISQMGIDWMQPIQNIWFEYLFFVPGGWKHPMPWAMILIAGALVAIFQFKKHLPNIELYRGFVLAGLIILIHGGIFIVFKAPAYKWYLFPTKILLIPFYAWSLVALWNFAQNKPSRKIARIASRTLAALLLAYTLYGHTVQFQILGDLAKTGQRGDKGYIRVGKLLRDSPTPASWKFACVEIGILGYYSNMQCLDLAGLISPECRDYFNKETLSETTLRFMPEIYITSWFPELSETATDQTHREKFLQNYRLVDQFNDENEVRIYCRKDLDWSPIRTLAEQPL